MLKRQYFFFPTLLSYTSSFVTASKLDTPAAQRRKRRKSCALDRDRGSPSYAIPSLALLLLTVSMKRSYASLSSLASMTQPGSSCSLISNSVYQPEGRLFSRQYLNSGVPSPSNRCLSLSLALCCFPVSIANPFQSPVQSTSKSIRLEKDLDGLFRVVKNSAQVVCM